jgi:hypothetical protein
VTIFLESPVPIICIGIAVEAVLGLILLRTGRGVLLWAMGGMLLLVLGGVLLERLVVTEKERVEDTIYGAIAALEANNEKGVFEYIVPPAVELRALVHSGMQRVQVTSVKLTRLELDINDLTSPPTAEAHIQGIISVEDRTGSAPYQNFGIRELVLELRRDPNRWVITGYVWKDRP